MLQIVTRRSEVKAAQQGLEKALKSALKSPGIFNIGFRGGNADQQIYSAGEDLLYCAFGQGADAASPRYWNSFGVFKPEWHAQHIVVEINVPFSGDNRRFAGFFAKDVITGDVFLMHDGSVGGGRLGIGRASFLSFISDKPVRVEGVDRPRYGLAVSNIADPNLPALVWRFTKQVQEFKAASQSHEFDLATQATDLDSDYSPEYSGRKRGKRSGQVDYFTYHGMIVDAMMAVRVQSLGQGERIGKSKLVDLSVLKSGRRMEVYEVKTSADRQSIYTGIGQLVTHGLENETRKFLLLPEGDSIPTDCMKAISSLAISLGRFKIEGQGIAATVKILTFKVSSDQSVRRK